MQEAKGSRNIKRLVAEPHFKFTADKGHNPHPQLPQTLTSAVASLDFAVLSHRQWQKSVLSSQYQSIFSALYLLTAFIECLPSLSPLSLPSLLSS